MTTPPEAHPAATTGPNAPPKRTWRLVAAAVFVLALGFGGWGLWSLFAPGSDNVRAQLAGSERQGRSQTGQIEELQQRVSTLTRSDQISRDANRDLQGALAERDEEVAGLRADVAFYERLVGATGQRRGLAVHALKMLRQAAPASTTQPQDAAAWHFTTTLTQNLNRGAVSAGQVSVSIEGTRGGQLQKLAWADLRQQPNAPGVPYSFKYFEQVEGDVFVPAGVTPVRVTVRLQPRSGAAVEHSFSWADATGEQGASAAVK